MYVYSLENNDKIITLVSTMQFKKRSIQEPLYSCVPFPSTYPCGPHRHDRHFIFVFIIPWFHLQFCYILMYVFPSSTLISFVCFWSLINGIMLYVFFYVCFLSLNLNFWAPFMLMHRCIYFISTARWYLIAWIYLSLYVCSIFEKPLCV